MALHQDLWDKKGYHALPVTLALGIAEEAGEVAQAIILTECPDFVVPPEKTLEKEAEYPKRDLAAEIGDVITYCLHLCNIKGIVPEFEKLDKL